MPVCRLEIQRISHIFEKPMKKLEEDSTTRVLDNYPYSKSHEKSVKVKKVRNSLKNPQIYA